MTREVWSSPQPPKGNEKLFTSSLKQKESSLQVVLGNRREFLSSRELPYLLVSRFFLKKMEATLLLARVKGDRAPPASKKKSPLPHLRQEETSSFLQSGGTEESFISTKQAGPSNLTRKKRAPPTPQSAKKTSCLTLLARERTELLTISSSSSEDGRELTLQEKAWSSPDLQREKSGPPPLPSLQKRKDEYSTSCSHFSGLERLSVLFHRRQCLAHPFIFPATMLWKTFNRKESPPHVF